MTSLNASGFSISLLNASTIHRSLSHAHVELLSLIDDPTDAVSWIGSRSTDRYSENEYNIPSDSLFTDSSNPSVDWKALDMSPSRVKAAIINACNAALEAENDLTQFDSIVGDGDCGETFARGARGKYPAIVIFSLIFLH